MAKARALVRPDILLKNRPGEVARRHLATDAQRALHAARLASIGIGEILPTPPEENSRQEYDASSIQEMADSIRTHGIIQPIVVRPIQPHEEDRYAIVINGEKAFRQYVIIAGNRRYHGAVQAGLIELPCVIRVTDADRAYVLNLVENLQRRELSGRERAQAIARLATLQDDNGVPLGVREIARRTQFSVATISQWLNIHKRPALTRAVEEERLDIGRAMRLASLPEEVLETVITAVMEMPRGEMERYVSDLRNSTDFRAERAVTLNVRRAMQAYRALSLIDHVEKDVREAVELTFRRAAQLLGVDVDSVSLANTSGGRPRKRERSIVGRLATR